MAQTPINPPAPNPPAPKPADKPARDMVAENKKHQERKALAKLDRIKKWPKEHQADATARAQEKLNNIRQGTTKSAS